MLGSHGASAEAASGESPKPSPAVIGTPVAGAPNVLIFMPDQQNGSTVMPGSPVIKPAMDKFMKTGIAFTQAHCPAPHCCPSRASFMSSMYPSEHGVYNNVDTETAIHKNPYPGTPFWGLWLKEAGYNLGYAGKLHVGRDITPESCGFENLSHLEQDSIEAYDSKKVQRWEKEHAETSNPAERKPGEYLRPDWENGQLYKTLPGGAEEYEKLADTKIMRAGIAGLKRIAAKGTPWCVMISNSGSHDPYDVPKNFVDQYDLAKIELPPSFEDMMDDKPRVYQRQRFEYWSQLSDEETRDAIRHYYAKCSYQDSLFGEMLAALESTGQVDNTIVLYVSDHGDYMGSHGLWMKGIPSFKEAYHIPGVIRWPKGIKSPGTQVDVFVDQVDWGATILDACGVTAKKKISGKSLLPFLRGETPSDWRQYFHSQMNGVELYYTQRITMSKDWKFVYNGFDYDELYDLRNDPHEMRNLAFPDIPAKGEAVKAGKGLPRNGSVPWPTLSGDLAVERKKLVKSMWDFATEHHDIIANPYGTVALAPYGPGLGQEPDKSASR
jgi:arylsulfatase A-like enzyme